MRAKQGSYRCKYFQLTLGKNLKYGFVEALSVFEPTSTKQCATFRYDNELKDHPDLVKQTLRTIATTWPETGWYYDVNEEGYISRVYPASDVKSRTMPMPQLEAARDLVNVAGSVAKARAALDWIEMLL